MKNSTKHATKLKPLLKKLDAGTAVEHAHDDDPVAVLIFSSLLAGSTVQKAQAAYQALLAQVVDFNDLRVCMPHEIVELIGKDYPDADDHARRLRAALRGVYLREHEMTLARVAEMGKREIRTWVESLDGALPYAKARLLLCSFDIHSIPVDEQMLELLIDGGAADEAVDEEALGGWMTRQVKSGEGLAVHQSLQAWSDAEFEKTLRRKQRAAAAKKAADLKKAAKKSTAKKSAAKPAAKPAPKTTSKAKSGATPRKKTAAKPSRASATKKTKAATSKTSKKQVTKKTARPAVKKTTTKKSSSRKTTSKKTTGRRAGTGG